MSDEWQLTMNGEIKSFDEFEKLIDYLSEKKAKLYYCSIRKVVGTGVVGFAITREVKNEN